MPSSCRIGSRGRQRVAHGVVEGDGGESGRRRPAGSRTDELGDRHEPKPGVPHHLELEAEFLRRDREQERIVLAGASGDPVISEDHSAPPGHAREGRDPGLA